MANCALCGESCGFFSGGIEEITGKKLKMCRPCWTLLNDMESAYNKSDKVALLAAKSEISKKACTAEAKIITDLCMHHQKHFEGHKKELEFQERLKQSQKQAQLERSADDVVRCPKCGSSQITADKKGFSAGKAVVGVALTGGIGVAAGGIGSKKVIVTCLKCGNQWKAGK